jgi:ethanolamine utilization protein EutA
MGMADLARAIGCSRSNLTHVGARLAPEDERRLVQTWCDALVSLIRDAAGLPPHPSKMAATDALIQGLLVTEPPARGQRPRAITFSGGVAEYLYGRESGDYDDFGRALAAELKQALADGRIPLPVVDPGQGIRATVIGASQFTVQVSGNTIAVSNDDMLPLRNLPVAYPRVDLAADPTAEAISAAIRAAHERLDLIPGHDAVALAFRWVGDPLYARLRRLAEGIRDALPGDRRLPIVLLFDRDVGRLVGDILRRDLHLGIDVVSVDGMRLKEFDYVDIGEIVRPNRVVPVVIKSLLFGVDGKQA